MERHYFDEDQPTGSMSLMNLRNAIRSIHQGDLMPFRPRCTMKLDDMEYSSAGAARNEWSGTGVTIYSPSGTKHDGNFALQADIDGTDNREIARTQALDLSAFENITLWERCNLTNSSAIQLYLSDGTNESYWDITTNAASGTWQQDTLALDSPDSNNGTDATLSVITEWGFRVLDDANIYHFDDVKVVCGLNVAVEGTDTADYYRQVYITDQPLTLTRQPSPTISPPTSNSRIDVLVASGTTPTLHWVIGAEGASPSLPTIPPLVFPICAVYQKTTMTKVVDYEDKDTSSSQAYIYKDIRRVMSVAPEKTDKSIVWYVDGTLSVKTTQSARVYLDFDGTITTARANVDTAPVGADLIFDINKNGSTIWSTQANRLTITDGNTTGSATTFNTVSVAKGDYLTIDVDQIGSSAAGGDLSVQLTIEQT